MVERFNPIGLFLGIIFLFVLCLGFSAIADAEATINPFEFSIDVLNDIALGSSVSVPVFKTSGTGPIYGFDLLIQYDTLALHFDGVAPGVAFDIPGDYEWEYFIHSVSSGINPGQIHVVALAETDDGGHHPVTEHIPDGTALFSLEFTVSSDSSHDCEFSPLNFYWTDCGDNAIAADSTGDTLAISDNVFQWAGGYYDITQPTYGVPGMYGAPDSCIYDGSIVRAIDFYNGGMDIHCSGVIIDRGDVNCNGIAYEIADAVMFENYLLNGLTAFGTHYECSSANSDANADGLVLRLDDFIYLYRVLVGDALPYAKKDAHDYKSVTVIQDDDAKTIAIDYADSLAAVYLVFDGDVTPTLSTAYSGVDFVYTYDGSITRVLATPSFAYIHPDSTTLPGFTPDTPFLTYTGSALLVGAQLADYHDNIFLVSIENSGSNLTISFIMEIGDVPTAAVGANITVPIIKTGGSEGMSGFDFLVGYDPAVLSLAGATPDTMFAIPGNFEWEYFTYRTGPFDCVGAECPGALVRVVGIAETNNGEHSPLQLNIPDGTIICNLLFHVSADPAFAGTTVPLRFFWLDCGDNSLASAPSGDTLFISDKVYDYDGAEITDNSFGFPGRHGAPDDCLSGGSSEPVRFVDFNDGLVGINTLAAMELFLSVDDITAMPGDSDIYLDVHMSNPQDSVAGFIIHFLLDRPDLVEFGRTASDTTAYTFEGALTADWDIYLQSSQSGDYYEVRVLGISNDSPPYTKAIPPQSDGVLLRLLLHAYDGLPPILTDSVATVYIDENISFTNFSDPSGNLIGLLNMAYNPETVGFDEGSIQIIGYTAGDANGDDIANIGDVVYVINYVFNGGPAPDPYEAGDANCDIIVNVADAVYVINYVFNGGPAPCVP